MQVAGECVKEWGVEVMGGDDFQGPWAISPGFPGRTSACHGCACDVLAAIQQACPHKPNMPKQPFANQQKQRQKKRMKTGRGVSRDIPGDYE